MLLRESKTNKNLHLEHLEDSIFNSGVVGVRSAVSFLQSLRDMLAGNSPSSRLNISTKFDGSPSIVAGINPETKKFFVGTKSVFAKNAKINYTDKDIDENHPDAGLNKTLKVALRYLKALEIKGVIQGDVMFTDDLKHESIDGRTYVTFQPNTLVYAVPNDAALASQIEKAKIGVVWHTSYTGPKLEDMEASPNVNVGALRITPDVWTRDASFIDASGTATFTETEMQQINQVLAEIVALFKNISSKTLNEIALSQTYKTQIKQWNNSKIRDGQKITSTLDHFKGLVHFVETKLNASIIEAKKSDTKQRRQKEKTVVLNFYKQNSLEIQKIFQLYNYIVDAKHLVIRKLEKVRSIGTFLRTDDGFKVTSPEGFVATDRLSGNTIKLVDRMVFSRANFNTAKNWSQ